MRCREARLRLAEHKSADTDLSTDQELLDHLMHCPDCARDLMAEKTLKSIIEIASANDTKEIVPLAQQKVRVESRVADPGNRTGAGVTHKPGLLTNFMRKPTLSFGTIIAVVVLAFLTLVPFKYSRTIGYTITMDGVNKELADDIERICNMLSALGLHEAEVDILGCDSTCRGREPRECDTTCSLLFVELKTEEEVQRVINAFAQVDPEELKTDVKAVRTRKSGTLLDQANETILQRRSDRN